MAILGLIIVGAVLIVMGYAVFLALLDANARRWPDDDPTLDVQNHHGDARAVR